MVYRRPDAPTSPIAADLDLLHRSEALQLQQSSYRMSWNAAGCETTEQEHTQKLLADNPIRKITLD